MTGLPWWAGHVEPAPVFPALCRHSVTSDDVIFCAKPAAGWRLDTMAGCPPEWVLVCRGHGPAEMDLAI